MPPSNFLKKYNKLKKKKKKKKVFTQVNGPAVKALFP